MTDLITTDLVRLGADWGSDKHDVIRALAAVVDDAGRASDKDQLVEDAFARESTSATGLPGGIAIPHCRTTGVETPTLAFARLDPPVDFGAKDGPADLAFLIAAPAGGDADHLTILTKLARALVKPAFTDALRVGRVGRGGRRPDHPRARRARRRHRAGLPPRRAPAAARRRRPQPPPRRGRRRAAGRAASPRWSRSPPARPASRTPTWPPRPSRPPPSAPASSSRSRPRARPAPRRSRPTTIAAAGAVIFAVDVGVRDRSRFAGKPMVSSGVKRPIDDADAMIAEALRYAADPSSAPEVEGTASEAGASPAGKESFGATRPPGPDDRRLLHDPVRRGRRPADRPRLPLRRLRDRQPTARRSPVDNTLFNLARRRRARPRPRPVRQRVLRLPRRAALHPRRGGVRVPRPGAGRLHRLRHRRPPRHRARLRDGRHRRHPQLRLPRRHRRRRARRRRGATGSPAGRCRPGCAG